MIPSLPPAFFLFSSRFPSSISFRVVAPVIIKDIVQNNQRSFSGNMQCEVS